MKKYAIILSLLFLAVSASAQSNDDKVISEVVNRMVAAQQDYRPDILDKLLTPDYVEVSPVGEYDERAKVLGFYKPEEKPPADKLVVTTKVKELKIRSYGKFAVAIAELEFVVTPAGKEGVARTMRATYVLRKDKEWLIASAQFTAIRQSK